MRHDFGDRPKVCELLILGTSTRTDHGVGKAFDLTAANSSAC